LLFPDSSRDRPSADGPKERPKLKLQPRTRPIEDAGQNTGGAAASIFGGAKPVDTAAREREIEERLKVKKSHPSEREARLAW
jgi:translation initiation factor 4B